MKTTILMALLGAGIFLGCRKKDAALPDNYVNFETSSQGISSSDSTITIKIKALSGVSADASIIINVTELGGITSDKYTISPELISGKLTLTIPSGNNETSFTVKRKTTALFDGTEQLNFDLYSSSSPLLIGTTKQLQLSFGEIVATTASMTLSGGGSTYPNKVFIDLSANRQTAVLRTTWDLGFYTGADDFRVILNSSVNMMAKQISKTDLTTVSSADTVGLTEKLSFSQTNPTVDQLPYIDYPSGDLTKTAIASIAASDTANKVYLINRGNGVGTGAASRGWKKVRILRNVSGGYTIQYADIDATSFNIATISKETTYQFKYLSFETGAVAVEPAKDKWDFAWTYFANVTNLGSGEVPYMFQDIILLNKNVQIAKVLTSTKSYADFTSADLATVNFLTTQNAIASDWRSGGGPTTSPAVRTDRFYIVKDAAGNTYKLRFTALTQNGERGYPSFEAVKL